MFKKDIKNNEKNPSEYFLRIGLVFAGFFTILMNYIMKLIW